jgi:hypothetical protein
MMTQRGDFTILHEPFSHLADFGRTTVDGEIIQSEAELITAIQRLAGTNQVFFKDTTDFRYPRVLTDTDFLGQATHTFIIRHPRDAIASHYQLNPRLTRDEVGFSRLHEIFEAVARVTGTTPVVIDADELICDPESVVRAYCRAVDIPFIKEALSWRPGMADQWQSTARWHASTGASSGFERVTESALPEVESDPVLSEYLRFHLPYYEKLREHRLRPAAT